MTTRTRSLAKRNDLHILRKLWHIGFGSAVLYAYYSLHYDIKVWGGFALACATIGFLIDFTRLNNEKFNQLALRVAGPIMRNSEKDGFSGLPFYGLGCALSVFLYQTDIALISIMFLVFADPVSSFVGVNFGKDKILPNKSLQGTIAGFFVCYLVTIVYISDYAVATVDLLSFAIVGGVIGAVAELTSAFNIDDNLTIPILSGAGLTAVNYFFQIF
jgi:diacylglycerol kinase (CTP)